MAVPPRTLVWLRRGLGTFVSLLGLTLVCASLWGLLMSLGDAVGGQAFRRATLGFALLDGACGVGLLIGTAWGLIHVIDPSRSSKTP